MVIFDILTKSLFNISLRDEKNGIPGFDYTDFLRAQDSAMREAVKRVWCNGCCVVLSPF